MKTAWSFVALTLLTGFTVSGQTARPVLVGFDILKPVLSLATPNRPAFRLLEASVKLPQTNRYFSITVGYGLFRSDTIYRNILLDTRGYYLKAGRETIRSSGWVVGWNGLIATCHESGTYSFRGPVFGDYVAPIPERSRLAVGLEGVAGYQTRLSQSLQLRLSGRITTAVLFGSKPSDMPAYFVPGMGLTAGDPVVYTVGLGVHLFYQLQSHSTATHDKNP
ncbi:hypothetical protein [Spirosoma koreense]